MKCISIGFWMTAKQSNPTVFTKRLHRIKELATEIGGTKWFWRSMIWDAQLPFVRVGKKMFVDRNQKDATYRWQGSAHTHAQRKQHQKGLFRAQRVFGFTECPTLLSQRFCDVWIQAGWRISEISSITWAQVDRNQGIVRLEVGETKNDEGCTVYLDDELKDVF